MLGNLLTLDEATGSWDRLHERRSGPTGRPGTLARIALQRAVIICFLNALRGFRAHRRGLALEAEQSALASMETKAARLRARIGLSVGIVTRSRRVRGVGEAVYAGRERHEPRHAARRARWRGRAGRSWSVERPRRFRAASSAEPLGTFGVARSDPALVAQAQERFEAMGLDWHAAQTRELGLDVVG